MNKLSDWQIELKKFNKQKKTEPVFINTFLTSADADILLESNSHNRGIKKQYITRHLKFMENNKWYLNGECIKISANGVLLDGQHRLLALQAYDQPVKMSVALGIKESNFNTLDTGLSRSSGDILKIAGYINCNSLAAVLRLLIIYNRSEAMSYNASIPPNDVLIAARHYPHMQSFCYPSRSYSFLCAATVIQLFMYLTNTIDPEKSLQFFNQLLTGENLGKTSSILLLRDLLTKYRMQKLVLDKNYIYATFIIAWNSFYDKRRINNVKWSGQGFPVISGINRKKLLTFNSGTKT